MSLPVDVGRVLGQDDVTSQKMDLMFSDNNMFENGDVFHFLWRTDRNEKSVKRGVRSLRPRSCPCVSLEKLAFLQYRKSYACFGSVSHDVPLNECGVLEPNDSFPGSPN